MELKQFTAAKHVNILVYAYGRKKGNTSKVSFMLATPFLVFYLLQHILASSHYC